MEMVLVISLIFLIPLICSLPFIYLTLPWINFSQIRGLRGELNKLEIRLLKIFAFLEKEGMKLPSDIQSGPNPWQQTQYSSNTSISDPITPSIPKSDLIAEDAVPKHSKKQSKRINFEQQFGIHLPVWIGGVALAFAGFFMVKYSIEIGLLSPTVRIMLGLMFGGGLLYTANWVRNKPQFANGTRIAQALSGAGIVDLYVCIFAAANLYDLIPDFIAFIAMAAVTATAVVLSIKHGMPIAFLGLIGGFLTPAMVSSQDLQTPILLIYLYFVFTGLMIVARKKCWWPMAIPDILSTFLWICCWFFGGNFIPGDTIWLGLFLIAVSTTVVITSKQQYDQDNADITNPFKVTSILNYLTLGGALLFTGVITAHAGFGLMEWGLFYLLSLGGIGLAYFDQRLYGLVPWLSIAVNAVMLMMWNTHDINAFALTISVFGTLYIACGYLLQSRSEKPLIWAGLIAATSIGYYFLGYYKLQNTVLVSDIALFWGILALAFGGFSTYVLQNILREVPENYQKKQHLMAIYAAMSTAFLSTALTIELPREFLSVAFAAQLFAIAWINTKATIKALRYIISILACVFGFLLIPQILLLTQLTVYSLVEAKLAIHIGIPIVDWPIFQLGLPALFFMMGSYLLRQQKDDKLVHLLEISAIALIGVMGYYLIRHAFHINESVLFVKAGFIERGVITNILFVYGLACLWVGRRFARQAVSLSGLALSSIAIFRISYFDFIIYNPLWSLQTIGELPILNALLLTYGLPILWTWKATLELLHMGKAKWSQYGYGFALLLSFVLISLNVRQIFQGTYLNGYGITNMEVYTYSMVWLLFGIALLFFGTLRKDKMIRVASLLVMILTVGKVFLYDASELEGLLRVVSFFGLGLSLLGLSWFYTQFVFGKRDLLESFTK